MPRMLWMSASAARRSRAARESGLGSTTVTRWPSSASGTANPPVPPPASRMSSRTDSAPDPVACWSPARAACRVAHTAALRVVARDLRVATTTLLDSADGWGGGGGGSLVTHGRHGHARASYPPELPGLECHNRRGAEPVSPPAGLMSE